MTCSACSEALFGKVCEHKWGATSAANRARIANPKSGRTPDDPPRLTHHALLPWLLWRITNNDSFRGCTHLPLRMFNFGSSLSNWH